MIRTRLLPFEYGVRNLLRRPTRSALTLFALSTVVLLVLTVVAFIRGMERSLQTSGEANVVLVYAIGAVYDLENSVIPARTAPLLAASLQGIDRRHGVVRVSPEVYMGTNVSTSPDGPAMLGVVRGVTPTAPLLRRRVHLLEGHWPGPGEVLVGRLTAAKLGCQPSALEIGKTMQFERRTWRIAGRFGAQGSAFDAEIWAPLEDLQTALKRQDLSLVAVGLAEGTPRAEVELFCKERYDLELQSVGEIRYYESLQAHYAPMRALSWLIVFLVGGAGVFAGLNTMYGAVVGRVRELATLQAIGFRRRAVVVALIQEAVLLSMLASLLAAAVAMLLVNGAAVRVTMGAFMLRVDSGAIVIGCLVGLLLGVVGALPPAIKAMRQAVAEGLKAV